MKTKQHENSMKRYRVSKECSVFNMFVVWVEGSSPFSRTIVESPLVSMTSGLFSLYFNGLLSHGADFISTYLTFQNTKISLNSTSKQHMRMFRKVNSTPKQHENSIRISRLRKTFAWLRHFYLCPPARDGYRSSAWCRCPSSPPPASRRVRSNSNDRPN